MKNVSIFGNFTRQYALSKTLRFELKPIGNTEKMLVDNDVFLEDGIRKEKYEKVKRHFDRLHREFVREALADVSLEGLDGYIVAFQKWQQDRKDKKSLDILQKKEKVLRQEIRRRFDDHAKTWAEGRYTHLKLKKKDTGLFFEEEVFALLSDRYGVEEDSHILNPETGEVVTIFDDWKGFTGYFKKFHETRRNFYKDDGTTTAIATRAIDQNLRRFCDNRTTFEKLKEKLDFSEIEATLEESVDDVFSMDFYDRCLLQEGIDVYNRIIGGETMKNGEKKKGINELINKYRQDNKGEKLPFLKTLDKQILSEKEKSMFGIENDEQCLDTLSEFYGNALEKVFMISNLISDFVLRNDRFDLRKVYFSREAVNTIAYRWVEDADIFEKALFDSFKKAKDTSAKYKKEDDSYSFPDFIALDHVRNAIEGESNPQTFWKTRYYKSDAKNGDGVFVGDESSWNQFLLILKHEFDSLFRKEILNQETGDKHVVGYDTSRPEFERFLVSESRKIDGDAKVLIKNFADDVLHIYQMGKYFSLEKKRIWNTEYETDPLFYAHPETGYMRFHADAYEKIVQKYNDLRSYLTKKPYSEKKWKLNFENPTLADGWDRNKEKDNSAVILRKDGKYYLGLMKKGNTCLFEKRNAGQLTENIEGGCFEKMVYKLFPDPSKMMPKVCFSQKGLEFFAPSSDIMRIYENGSFKKGDGFDMKDMQKLIGFYKECLASYPGWQCYDFSHVKETSEYRENIGEFYADVANDGYKIWFEKVSKSYIEKKNQDGELYLFEIYNQDFASGRKTGKKNLHTMYWEGLFSTENMDGFPLKLNGEAEIFYRPATPKEKLGTRTDADGKTVVAHKRYAENKVFFHCPITLNRGDGEARYFNQRINEFLADNPDINIIGIDRGEKHLAYYSVINQRQEILESGSLNMVGGVDYAAKLEKKAKGREQARRDWQSVEGIKDLKKGYISQVVRRLADLAIKHNAIIVLEDLNMRFKQIRGGIEKSIYQQLERALIDKLSFLVEKNEIDPKKAGHLLNAYQLAAPFESFQKMGKQTGIIFYVQASYTSKIDPVTGWRPNLYLKYGNSKKTQEEIKRFSKISFNEEDNRFEFFYDLKNFQEQNEWPENTKWTACSCVERFRWNKTLNQNMGGYDHYPDMTESFKALFASHGIDIRNDIKKQIGALKTEGSEKFFRDFVFFWNLLCQIRNTDPNKEKNDPMGDFILSPVEPFFDSRTSEKFGASLPKNGDDNGAYNIARKGAVVLEKIIAFKKEMGNCKKMMWGDLYVSHNDWDAFAQRNRS